MIRKCSLLFLLFTALIGSSCISVDQAPEVHGQVIDARTGKPLNDVKISYTRGNYKDDTTCDINGNFSIGPLADYEFFLFAGATAFVDIFNSYELGAPPLLKFEHPGYLSQVLNVYNFNGSDFSYDPRNTSWEVFVKMNKKKEKKVVK